MQQRDDPRTPTKRSRQLLRLEDQVQKLKPYVLNDFHSTILDKKLQQKQIQEDRQMIKRQQVRPICSITTEFIPRGKLYVADCLHAFHVDAIRNWVETARNLTCPVCRRRSVGFLIRGKYILGNRHTNRIRGVDKRGGWVATTANVAPTAYVAFNARVYEDAQVQENAKVFGNAKVYGNAKVFGDAIVADNAQVYGNAQVFGDAIVGGNAQVYGNAIVGGNAQVGENAQVYGDAQVSGNAMVVGDAKVFGDAQVYGNALVSGNAQVHENAHSS